MRICILGNSSFEELMLGSNHLAKSLTYLGHEVDYVFEPMSILRLFSFKTHKKFLRHCKLKSLGTNLNEIGQISLIPGRILKKFEGTKFGIILFNINKKFTRTKGNYIENKKYDICIFLPAWCVYSIKKIKADRYVYRYHDIMEYLVGFPKQLVKYERYILKRFPIDTVIAVNDEIGKYVKSKNKNLKVKVIPNGINLNLFKCSTADLELQKTQSKNVIFIGSIEFWIDINLIISTSKILSEYYFHIYGKWSMQKPANIPSNVIIHDSISYEEVPRKLKACSVGIIPFNSCNKKMFVQKPLKYYEYLASGLGIASTSYGMDRNNKFMHFGDTPEKFANAIVAANKSKEMFLEEKMRELEQMDWVNIASKFIE